MLVDEIYDAITYSITYSDDAGVPTVHTHLAAVAPDLLTLTHSGLSKNSRLAGYHAGWMVVTVPISTTPLILSTGSLHGLNLMASTRLCSNVPGQQAIVAALRTDLSAVGRLFLRPGGYIYL